MPSDRAAFDTAWLDKASRGDPVLADYLRRRMSDFLDWLWAEHVAAQVAETVEPDAGQRDA